MFFCEIICHSVKIWRNCLVYKNIAEWQICLYLQYLSLICHYSVINLSLIGLYAELVCCCSLFVNMGWQKRYYFWAIRIGLWGNKDATYWLKTMGLSFISPLFTMPISLIYDAYLPCLRFLFPLFMTLTDFTLHFSCCFTEILHSQFNPLLNSFTLQEKCYWNALHVRF